MASVLTLLTDIITMCVCCSAPISLHTCEKILYVYSKISTGDFKYTDCFTLRTNSVWFKLE